VTLTQEQVDQAIRRRAYELAAARGLQLPTDALDFQTRARVNRTADGGAAVVLEA